MAIIGAIGMKQGYANNDRSTVAVAYTRGKRTGTAKMSGSGSGSRSSSASNWDQDAEGVGRTPPELDVAGNLEDGMNTYVGIGGDVTAGRSRNAKGCSHSGR